MRFVVMLLVAFCALAAPTFAAGSGIAALDTMGDKILSLLTAKWLKALLAVGLVIEFGVIAFGNAQGEGGMVKKVLPWVIGTAGILGATSVVNFFFKGATQEALGLLMDGGLCDGVALLKDFALGASV